MDTRRMLFWVNIALVIAIVVSAVVLFTSLGQGPAPKSTPTGSISEISATGRTAVIVTFGNFSSGVLMSECIIQLTSPDGEQSRTAIEENVLNYPQTLSVTGLSNVKVSSTGTITNSTYITIENYRNLQLGSWAFKLIYKPTSGYIIEQSIIVPDTANTPTGYFSDYMAISQSEERLILGIISPATAPSFCKVVVKQPNSTEVEFNLTSQTRTSWTLEDGTIVEYVDQGADGIINANDYIRIYDDEPLKEGLWSVRIIYNYTDESFASVIFAIA